MSHAATRSRRMCTPRLLDHTAAAYIPMRMRILTRGRMAAEPAVGPRLEACRKGAPQPKEKVRVGIANEWRGEGVYAHAKSRRQSRTRHWREPRNRARRCRLVGQSWCCDRHHRQDGE